MPSPPTSGVSRRTFLVAGSAAATLPFLGASVPSGLGAAASDLPAGPRAFGFPEPDMTSRITRDITFPVEGQVSWVDTYGACRSGCSRRHEGQDLMAQKLQRLVAVRDGVVVALSHESGGNSLYLQDDDGWYYAYLHINNDTPFTDDGANPIQWAFAPGLRVGSRVIRGQHVAYVGDSGNAESAGSHCHFEIRKPTSSGVWRSQAVNPKYSLDAAKPPPARVPASTFEPWDNSTALIRQQYADFFGSAPDEGSLAYYRSVLDSGAHTPDWFIQVLLQANGCQREAGAVARLYHAYFGRFPDQEGFAFWLNSVRSGRRLIDVSQHFAKSTEFVRTFGDLSDAAFVETVYENVLDRSADVSGKAFWLDRLRSGALNRGGLMIEFSESSENRNRRLLATNVVLLYGLMVHAIPTRTQIDMVAESLETGASTHQELIRTLRLRDDYAARF